MNFTIKLLIFISLLSCSREKPKVVSDYFDDGRDLAQVKSKKLVEASGLAASASNPGFFWTHNDSGNKAELYLIDEQANVRLTCKLPTAKNRDWEDIAVSAGPDRSSSYIYIGDIGDNSGRKEFKIIYRLKEPQLDSSMSEITINEVDKIVFRLPGKRKDSEALLVHPFTKDIYIVTKRENPVFVYGIPYPYSTSDTLTASVIGKLPITQIVAADFSPDGTEVLMKNYQTVYYWTDSVAPNLQELLQSKMYMLPYEEEPQGEAITFARDGSGYYTISEKLPGEKSYLKFYKRRRD